MTNKTPEYYLVYNGGRVGIDEGGPYTSIEAATIAVPDFASDCGCDDEEIILVQRIGGFETDNKAKFVRDL